MIDLSHIEIKPQIETLKILDISDEEYFGSDYKDYISNSRLALINPDQGGSPKDFFEGLSKHNKYSDSLYFGSCVHEFVLQPNDFYLVENVSRPTAKLGFMADILYRPDGSTLNKEDYIKASDKVNYYKGKIENKIEDVFNKCSQYWKDRREFESKYNSNKVPVYLNSGQLIKLKACLDSVYKNKRIQALLNPDYIIQKPISENEQTVLIDVIAVVDNKEVPLKLKAKFDNFTINYDTNTVTLNDLKTTGHYIGMFSDSWNKYHYYRQAGMYMWLLTLVSNHIYDIKNPTLKGNMLLVSTIPEYKSGIFEIHKKEFIRGFNEFKHLLKLVAYYKFYGYD